jgi:hypothetical protein
MKKVAPFLILIILLAPSIASAVWWNPFSWFNDWHFNRIEVDQVVEDNTNEQIKELQNELEKLKNQTNNGEEVKIPTSKGNTIGVPAETTPIVIDTPLNTQLTIPTTTQNDTISTAELLTNASVDYYNSLLDEAEERRNSPECKEAESAWEEISDEIDDLSKGPMTPELASELADLSIQSVPIGDEYFRICEDYVAPPLNTITCTYVGVTISCTY